MNGKVVKFGRGEYSIISVFKCYRQLLLEQIHRSNENITIAQNTIVKKSGREESLTAKLSMGVAPSMLDEIKKKDNWQELVRNAIALILQSA